MASLIYSWSVLLLFVTFLVFVCLYVHHRLVTSKYWSKRNIAHLPPLFLLGNFAKANFTENFLEVLARYHSQHSKKKILGMWMFTKPNLLVMDLELAKRMLIRDFNNFRDRGLEIDKTVDPLAAHLFLLCGKEWRNLRVRLTPTFTSGKMKMMFPTMAKCAEQLRMYVNQHAEAKDVVEVKDLLSRFTTDVIGSCAFGIEINSLQNPRSEFREFGSKIFAPDLKTIILNSIVFTFPNLMKTFKIRLIPKDVTEFFLNTVKDTVEYREKTQTKRNDFLQLIIQLMKAGKIEDVDKTDIQDMDDEELVQKFSLHDAAAQCFVFFTAGFETSSTALTFALYELALNPDIQKRLQEEIDDILEPTGEITYEKLHDSEYLDMVVQETLRKYPPVANLQRMSLNDYHIPELNVTLEKGTLVLFSVKGIHYDPELYPDPERFDPERFTQEERKKRHICAFLPFGEGPRNCIGNRFALMQIKVALASIFRDYDVEVTKTTPIPIVYDVRSFLPMPVGGMPLVFTKRVCDS